MGYYSKVCFRIEGEKEILNFFVRDLKERLIKNDYEEDFFNDKFARLIVNEDYIILHFPCCKWYDFVDNHFAQIITKIVKEYYYDKGLIEYHFIRIGEELEDIEEYFTENVGEYLYIKREIEY
jgi:hypothetical protein